MRRRAERIRCAAAAAHAFVDWHLKVGDLSVWNLGYPCVLEVGSPCIFYLGYPYALNLGA